MSINDFITLKDASERAGVSLGALKEWILRNFIKQYEILGVYAINVHELDALIKYRKENKNWRRTWMQVKDQ